MNGSALTQENPLKTAEKPVKAGRGLCERQPLLRAWRWDAKGTRGERVADEEGHLFYSS